VALTLVIFAAIGLFSRNAVLVRYAGMALCPYNLLQTAIVPKLLDESSCFFCHEGFFPPILHCVVMQLIRFQLTKRRAFIYDS